MSELHRIIGPYRILEPIGEGAMGVVYRAVHLESRSAAAVKTVHLPGEGLVQSLRREIHALARVCHPGVVRILDEGVHDGVPWYAMELVEGVPVHAEVLRERPLLDRLTLVRRLCAPLAYLHGEGIVHRDLKPGNVLVRPDGLPVLVDFGLVGRFAAGLSREALEVEAAAGGTVAYMAPEQARGRLVDARADLYSLGCMVYELLTGRPPFVGPTAVEVLFQHLEAEPLAPSKLAAEVPPDLDALVLRLLAKDPRERFGHADDVASALAGLGAEDGLAGAGPKPRAYLYRPAFAGREQALAELERQLAKLQGGSGACVLLAGESGIGKTRLAMELARRAERFRARVASGECLPPSAAKGSAGAGGPLHPLRRSLQAIADRCRERGVQEAERLLGSRGKLLALYEPALRSLPGQEAHPEPAELPPEAARQRLFGALSDTYAALAQDRPLLLILDDLQWADGLTADWLAHLLHTGGLERLPLLVLGTYRMEELNEQLEVALKGSGARRLELGRLDEQAIGSMVGDMLALAPPPAVFVQYLTRHSEGNPFFVAEYLRTAVDEGVLYRDELGRWQVAEPGSRESGVGSRVSSGPGSPTPDARRPTPDYESLPLPDSLRELVARRLEGLGTTSRDLVELAAVLGRELTAGLLARVAGSETVQLLEPLHELIRRQVLEEIPGGERLRFVHDKIREVTYERLVTERRRDLHRAAAEAIETLSEPERDEHLAALGRHWEEAGDAAKACQHYLAAATRARDRYAYHEAERLYRAYLGLVAAPNAQSIEARLSLGHPVLHSQNRNAEAIAEARCALEESRRLGDEALAAMSLRSLGVLHEWSGELELASELCEQALTLARRLGNRAAEGRALSDLGNMARRQGRYARAAALTEEAMAVAREIGDRRSEAIGLGNLAAMFFDQGPSEAARTLFEQALAIHREIRNPWHEEVTLRNLALIALEQGRLEEMRGLCEQALAIQERIGVRRGRGMTLATLAYASYAQKDFDQARALLEQAVEAARLTGNRAQEGAALGNLAMILAAQGRVPDAFAHFELGLGLLHGVGDRRSEASALLLRAALERQAGALDRADEILRQTEALLAAIPDSDTAVQLLCQRGMLNVALGRPAREQVELARERASRLGVRSTSEAAQAVTQLLHSVEAFEAGRPLFRGERVEDLPAGLRQWLIQSGQLAGSGGEPGERRERT
jgi:predicted ATPase